MFDIGATELLVIAIVAILVIGPKDMPMALRTAGRWIAKLRRVSGHFRAGVDAMIREAELEEMEREWRDRNAQVMREHPDKADPARLKDPAEPAGSASSAPVSAEARLPVADGAPDAPDAGPASDRPA